MEPRGEIGDSIGAPGVLGTKLHLSLIMKDDQKRKAAFLHQHLKLNNKKTIIFQHVFHKYMVGGSTLVGFPFVSADTKQDRSGKKHGLQSWHTSALATRALNA